MWARAVKGWDLRMAKRSATFTNRREHGAGVCTIRFHPSHEHVFVTGSYDEHVRACEATLD